MTEANSLQIDTPADPQALSYTPDAPKAEPKAPTMRQALERAAADVEKGGEKIGTEEVEEKEKPQPNKAEVKEEKPARERTETGKFTKKAEEPSGSTPEEGAEQNGETESRSSEGREEDKPPARFLPRAKEKWPTVDAEVRGEVLRMHQEMERGINEHRESHEFRKSLREFETMAQQAGTTVPDALRNYTNIDRQLREDPAGGVARILQSIGLTPQQYAQFVLGQAQQQQQNPQFAETQRLQSQIQQLNQTVQQLTQGNQQDREQARVTEVERSIIEPFKAEHPRYTELEADIAFFLTSGKIPSTLNEQSRLAAAYDMAERINPAPGHTSTTQQTRPLNPAGAKSIKGAPGSIDLSGSSIKPKSFREATELAMSRLGTR